MKYASEVIDLLAAYPGREFRMAQIVRHVTQAKAITESQRGAVREGVRQVLVELSKSGQVQVEKTGATSATYTWELKLQDLSLANCKGNCKNTSEHNCAYRF